MNCFAEVDLLKNKIYFFENMLDWYYCNMKYLVYCIMYFKKGCA